MALGMTQSSYGSELAQQEQTHDDASPAHTMTLAQLPKEMVQEIASFLDPLSCGALRQTSRSLNSALAERIFIQKSPDLAPYAQILKSLSTPSFSSADELIADFQNTPAPQRAAETLLLVQQQIMHTLQTAKGTPVELTRLHMNLSLPYVQSFMLLLNLPEDVDAKNFSSFFKFMDNFTRTQQQGYWNSENPEENHKRLPHQIAVIAQCALSLIDHEKMRFTIQDAETQEQVQVQKTEIVLLAIKMQLFAGERLPAKNLYDMHLRQISNQDPALGEKIEEVIALLQSHPQQDQRPEAQLSLWDWLSDCALGFVRVWSFTQQ